MTSSKGPTTNPRSENHILLKIFTKNIFEKSYYEVTTKCHKIIFYRLQI